MTEFLFDVHLHTHHSYDSLMTPTTLVRTAKKQGLSAIVVTDHNTTKGAFSCIKAAKENRLDITVLVGAEIKTEVGDVSGLFLNEEIRSREFHDVINDIAAQDGIVCLPHPYASYTSLDRMDLSKIEVLEAYNGRHSLRENQAAFRLGKKLGLPMIGGSDSHLQYEVGSVVNITHDDVTDEDVLRKKILDGTSIIRVRPPTLPLLPRYQMTQYMSWLRTGKSRRILDRVLHFSLRMARKSVGFSA
ncbi:MAG: PHP domain-containing protein [Candidatus Thorarchaeota archaeon]